MKDDNDWHLSKTLNIGHIGTTVVAVIGVMIYVSNIQTEVAKQSVEIKNIKEEITHLDASQNSMFKRIDGKLEKLFDLLYEMKTK